MNECNIDISNVQTMGEFRVAIQEAVKDYVSAEMYGIHGVKNIQEEATGGLTETEEIAVTIDFSNELQDKTVKHWGIFNIINDCDEYTTHVVPQAQIVVWWDNSFHYTITHNALRVGVSTVSNPPQQLQYVKDNSVKFDNNTNTLQFTIINSTRIWNGNSGTTRNGKFKIDYHIW